jgi:hypothetical protein
MAWAFKCRCGQILRLAAGASAAVRCPACGQNIPPQARRAPRAWLFAAGAALVVLAAGLAGAIHLLGNAEPDRSAAPADASAGGEKPTSPGPNRTSAPGAGAANPSGNPSPEEKVRPRPSPPGVTIRRGKDARLHAGGSLTVLLAGTGADDAALKYQYRTGAESAWRSAPRGRIHLTDLKAGTLTLHVRAVDSRGRSSPVVTHSWTVEPPGPLKAGDTFYQEVVVSRLSRYRLLGGTVSQNVSYSFLSSFKVEKVNPDGGGGVVQKVEAARFGKGDAAMQALLKGLLQQTKGATFKITLNARGVVTGFEGGKEAVRVFEGKNALGGQTFLLWSFLDKDGWKELAQVSLLRPEKPSGTAQKWAHKITHSWGPLGRWAGRVVYGYTGKKAGLDQIGYVLDMGYQPPAKGAAAGLPFTITRAAFKPQTAAGVVLYDTRKSRVVAAEERFHVKGLLAVSALGTNVDIDMDEAQYIQVRLSDQKPEWK